MDRDRERDRDRDRRDDRYSNTYRPRSPRPRSPRGDTYRAGRSPPRRSSPPRRGLASADTYTPGGRSSRPRSRSPAFRRRSRSPRRDDNWRARPRSPPPRRAYSPRRDDFRADRARSPRRDAYDSYTRSPRPRERSPLPRDRDVSPARSRGVRSPVRSSRYEEPRSRVNSPPRRYSPARDTREYRRRSQSPRRDRVDPYPADTWRSRRSPSPARANYASNDASGRESAATSRRSSPPPIHPSRAALVDERSARDGMAAPRSPFRERDHERGRDYPREGERDRSPPRRRSSPPAGPRRDRDVAPPTGPSSSGVRNGDNNNFSRAPPTGPSGRSYPSPAISPPASASGPSPQPPSFPRGSNPVLAAPTRPRGGGGGRGGFPYDSPRDFSGASSRRGSWGAGPRGGGFYGSGAPSGPRGGGAAPFAPSFRGSSNSTATTYPRTMRFRDHLADLPKEVPGGSKAPEVYDKSRLLKLEEETRRLRELIEKKEDEKRQKLREWEALERDAGTAQVRVELAEASLRDLNGEGDVSSAF